MNMFDEKYDVVVVGAGHAGCEAAYAAARMGLATALYTMNVDLIAQMSCNPAVGGIAKGHLVREIDAMGGLMGLAADEAGIQFRLLNTSRGPAVWSPRAQEDKAGYRQVMRRLLEATPNLYIKQAEVIELLFDGDRAIGIELMDGRRVAARGHSDHGNVPEWPDSHRRKAVQFRPQRRTGIDSIGEQHPEPWF